MKNWAKGFGLILFVTSIAVMTGCEFEGTGDGSSYNSGPSWVNFSGVYKASGGGVLVSAFTTTSSGGTATNGASEIIVVNDENIEQGDGASTTFSGFLNNESIVAGSVDITAGGFNLTDDGLGGLSGGNAFGTIDYGTGAWSIDLQGVPLDNGTPITADYSFIQIIGGGGGDGGGGGSGSGGGSSGKAIFSFAVFQAGNKLEITDNNGAKYTGQLGKVATTSGLDDSNPLGVVPSVGDTAIAEYTARGTSAAGVSVLMTGTFQGGVSQGSGALFFSDRRMLGTWIEDHGKTGDINGSAAPIAISAATTAVTP